MFYFNGFCVAGFIYSVDWTMIFVLDGRCAVGRHIFRGKNPKRAVNVIWKWKINIAFQ